MSELFFSPFFGVGISAAAYWVGQKLQKKTGFPVCNPLLAAILLVSGLLLLLGIPYEAYNQGGAVIQLFLNPATACLAISIHARIDLLKRHWLPILAGCLAGCLTSLGSIYLLCRLFQMDGVMTASLLPKSVTTPIAIGISENLGGIPSITVVAVMITGILGSILAPTLICLFRVKEPLIAGLAIGACSHAMGTSRAIELGETEGAMSGLAIGICGILTVLLSTALI